VRCYLVVYDIRHPRRLTKVHDVMMGYGEPWQYSVFFCVLKDIDRVRLDRDLQKQMNLKEDQTIVIDLGGDEVEARKSAKVIGQGLPPFPSSTIVV